MSWFTCFERVFARKVTASETLPLYLELYPAEQTQEAALPHTVYRFQRFLTWRLAIDYGVASSIRKADILCNPDTGTMTIFVCLASVPRYKGKEQN